MSSVNILAIESSCDETAAAVVADGRRVLSNIIHSQIDIHRAYGGVVPEIASRNHIMKVDMVVAEALAVANISISDIHAIAVTNGPGLVGALLVGLNFAKGLCFARDLLLIGVHHIEGHICSNYLENPEWMPPYAALVVSGGHTHLVHVRNYGDYALLGRTRDDAAGEAFDKVARSLGLPYPGGVEIDKLSKIGNPTAIAFPKTMLEADSLDFSFSGLKSAVLNHINSQQMAGRDIIKPDIAASFQHVLVDVLVQKSLAAAERIGTDKLAIAGGVAANSALREKMAAACDSRGIRLNIPPPIFCTDNAAMIAACGYYKHIRGHRDDLSLNAYPSMPL